MRLLTENELNLVSGGGDVHPESCTRSQWLNEQTVWHNSPPPLGNHQDVCSYWAENDYRWTPIPPC
jgi:hypothetical protein